MMVETTDYISYIRDYQSQLGGYNARPILLLFAMSGKYDSPLYHLLNCAAMELLVQWCEGEQKNIEHMSFSDADKCIALAYKCMKEHVSCTVKRNPTNNSFNALIPKYEDADIGTRQPFKSISFDKLYMTVDWSGNGIHSMGEWGMEDKMTPTSINHEFRRMAASLHMMTRSDFGSILGKYAGYLEELPTMKEMQRTIKETPPIESIVCDSNNHKPRCLMDAIFKGNLEGQYAYATKRHTDGYEIVHLSYRKCIMRRTHASSSLLLTTMLTAFSYNPYRQNEQLENIDMSSMSKVMQAYKQQIDTQKKFLNTLRRQRQHIMELCRME